MERKLWWRMEQKHAGELVGIRHFVIFEDATNHCSCGQSEIPH